MPIPGLDGFGGEICCAAEKLYFKGALWRKLSAMKNYELLRVQGHVRVFCV